MIAKELVGGFVLEFPERSTALINFFCVLVHHQGKNVGLSMVRDAQQRARARGCKQLRCVLPSDANGKVFLRRLREWKHVRNHRSPIERLSVPFQEWECAALES